MASPETLGRPDALARITVWIFDLDNTLYPASCRLFDQVDRRIGQFIAERFALDSVSARVLQKRYFRDYGTTLRGLMTEHGVDPNHFLDYVHEIDHSPVSPSPALAAALGRLAGRKLVFTNGSRSHAERVMARLGVADHFEAVFDIADASFAPKPDPASYQALIAQHGIAPTSTAMIDDIARNLEPAAALGMTTVWLTPDAVDGPAQDIAHVHYRTGDLVAFLEAVLAARGLERGVAGAGSG